MSARTFIGEVFKSLEDRLRLMELRDAEPSPTTPINQDTYEGTGPIPGPGVPYSYNGPEVDATQFPRLFDYNFMANLNVLPRAEFPEVASMAQLQFAYYETDILQVASNWRIDRLLGVDHSIELKDGGKKKLGIDKDLDRKHESAMRLIEYPDPTRDWNFQQWARVIYLTETINDATCVYPLKTWGGDTVAWQAIDGRTIKPIMDYSGGYPQPPEGAFQQYIKGYPNRMWSLDEMGYFPSRPRPGMLYGESRVEQIMHIARTARNHMRFTDEWYTEGNIPEAILSMPLEYFQGQGSAVADKVQKLQTALDAMAGNNRARRRLFLSPVPGDIKPLKTNEFDVELPDWLARPMCVRFGCPASLFVSENNKATATQVSKDTHDADFSSSLKWMEGLMNRLLAKSGFSEFEFKYYPLQNFDMVHVQGVMLAASTPLPISEDNLTGAPAVSYTEAREALGFKKSKDDDDKKQLPLAPPPLVMPGQAAPANQPPQAAQPAAGANVLPMKTKGILDMSRGARARQMRFNTERAAHVKAYLPNARDILAANEKKILEQAKRAAAARGKKII